MKASVYRSRSSLYWGLFENGFRRAEKGAECETDEGDLVLDPFAGSNTTGAVAEKLQRRWIAIENVEAYLEASKFRFD